MGRNVNIDLPEIKMPKVFPHMTTIKSIFHMLQILATVLTICVVAPVIATEVRFYDGSQPGPNYTLAVGLMSLSVPIGLLVFPWIYNRNGKFRRLGKFCLKPRTSLIFTSFYTGFWATAGIAMTVHANNPNNCALYSDKEEDFGDDYRNAWSTQCSCARAAAGLTWATCVLWLFSLLCTLIIFFKEKQLIQKNMREHEANKNAVLMQQQQQQQQLELDDDLYTEEVGRHGGYRQSRYYEDDGDEDLGGMRPQSLEQARPLQDPTPPTAALQGQSPFDSPYDHSSNRPTSYMYNQHVAYDPHAVAEQQQQLYQPYDPYPESQQTYPAEQSPFDDRYAHETHVAAGGPLPHPPPVSFTSAPIVMPDHNQYIAPRQSSPT